MKSYSYVEDVGETSRTQIMRVCIKAGVRKKVNARMLVRLTHPAVTIDDYVPLLPAQLVDNLVILARQVQHLRFVHVNSTAVGGGVAALSSWGRRRDFLVCDQRTSGNSTEPALPSGGCLVRTLHYK